MALPVSAQPIGERQRLIDTRAREIAIQSPALVQSIVATGLDYQRVVEDMVRFESQGMSLEAARQKAEAGQYGAHGRAIGCGSVCIGFLFSPLILQGFFTRNADEVKTIIFSVGSVGAFAIGFFWCRYGQSQLKIYRHQETTPAHRV